MELVPTTLPPRRRKRRYEGSSHLCIPKIVLTDSAWQLRWTRLSHRQIDEYLPRGAESSSTNRAGQSEVIDLTGSPTPARTFVPEQRHTRNVHTTHLDIEALLQATESSSPSSSGGGQQRRRSQRIANLNSAANARRAGTPAFSQSQADVLSQLQDTGSVDTIATLPTGTRIRVRAEVIKDEGGSVVPEVKVED